MNWERLREQITIRGILRNMVLYEVIRFVILVGCKAAWPNYSAVIVDFGALLGALLDDDDSRSWPRFVLSAVIVESIRYLVWKGK